MLQFPVFIRYTDGQVFSQFIDMISVPYGKAKTIGTAINCILSKKGIPTTK